MTKIEELKAAFEAATVGEWDIRPFGTSHAGAIGCGMELIAMMYNRNEEEADAHFITLAHNLMPTLLEAVEALEKMKTSFEDLLNGYPERELHEPYQVTLNRAHSILEKLK